MQSTRRHAESLAIVGIGLRFPGEANDPKSFWDLLQGGVDAICDVPAQRWDHRKFYDENPDVPGKMHVREAGFIHHPIETFDAHFFGMSPRDAMVLDPQQRLLLEVSWEAFEDAGIDPTTWRGSKTGVYIGGFCQDSLIQQLGPLNRDILMVSSPTAATMVMLSNRISYLFDLRGPSMSVDTACSSSLTAFHLACQAVWNGECDQALTGGVNVMTRPEYMICMARGGFLSPTGRCQAFDSRADGYVRSEGAAVLVIKRLSKALEDGDRIWALVRGTGANQDGRTQGITAPNPDSQMALAARVLDEAGVRADQIAYIEAHGTGTQAGDPVEANSLGAVIGQGRAAGDPCWMGSVKTNIGHMEAGAGVAGVIKAVLCLANKQVPPNLHFREANPAIDFDTLNLRVPVRNEVLDDSKGPLFACVNSFGYGGANAHVVLEQAPRVEKRSEGAPLTSTSLFPLSAKSEEALRQKAADLLVRLDEGEVRLDDLGYTLGAGRAHHEHRLALGAACAEELREALSAFVENKDHEAVLYGKRGADAERGEVVFVYTGMGSQWWGMGRELYEKEPVFARAIEQCQEAFEAYSSWSLVELFGGAGDFKGMGEPGPGSPMGEPRYAQPANLAIQVGLTAVWRARGLVAAAIVGHSVGEIAAAWAAGALSLEEAFRLSYHRSELQQGVLNQGTMLAVGSGYEAVAHLIEPHADHVQVAAYNSPESITLAGTAKALRAIAEELEDEAIFARMLQVDVAYHSAQMEGIEQEFRKLLGDIQAQAPTTPLYSTVTGRRIEGACHDVNYWWMNARQSVHFDEAIAGLLEEGHGGFVEVGPHPVLGVSIRQVAKAKEREVQTFFSLRRGQPEGQVLERSLGELYIAGVSIAWDQAFAGGSLMSLPSYPWQREHLWHESQESRRDRLGTHEHPLLHTRISASVATWETELRGVYFPYLADHVVAGSVVFPGAGYVAGALGMAKALGRPTRLEKIRFVRMLSCDGATTIRLSLDEGTGRVSIVSGERDNPLSWLEHARGECPETGLGPKSEGVDVKGLREGAAALDVEALYAELEGRGLVYGPTFRPIVAAWRTEEGVLLRLEARGLSSEDVEAHLFHPALLDGAFQGIIAAVEGKGGPTQTVVPVTIRDVRLHGATGPNIWVQTTITRVTPFAIEGDLVFADDAGVVVAEVYGLRCQVIAGSSRRGSQLASEFYTYDWVERGEAFIAQRVRGRWLIVAEKGASRAALVAALEGHEQEVVVADDVDLQDSEAVEELIAGVLGGGSIRGVVYWSVGGDLTGQEDCVALLHLVQALGRRSYSLSGRLATIVVGAHRVLSGDGPRRPAQSSLWGMGRVVGSEHGELKSLLVDVPSNVQGGCGHEVIEELAGLLLGDTSEDEVVLRPGRRWVHRLGPAAPSPSSVASLVETSRVDDAIMDKPVAFNLEVLSPGVLDSLAYLEVPRPSCGPRDIEIKVVVSPLNFKDVMKALNLLPVTYLENTYIGAGLGLECAGYVTEVGSEVEGFEVGDEVWAPVTQGGFRSYVRVDDRYVVPRVGRLAWEESVAFINYITAYQGLHRVGRLRQGERVLIHSATGGVGLAAVFVARWLGATIFATAGTEEKRQYLRDLGVEHVFDSRTLAFADEIMAVTQGKGVDVVLNSLSGEALLKSWEIVASYGRFVEIGKRNINEDTPLPMGVFDRNVSFAAIDIDLMMADNEVMFREIYFEVHDLLEAGVLEPLPVRVFAADEVSDAFRFMARAHHIGKVVVRMDEGQIPVHRGSPAAQGIREEGVYLVTGGLGGFGLEVARWLVVKGARHLVLVGRSGASTDHARRAVADLEGAGARVDVLACDVADRGQVRELFEHISGLGVPLRGVFHSAMVLSDGVIAEQDCSSFERVMAPKALGGWYLHEETQVYEKNQGTPLDHFVTFSSISALIGNAGQANYVAANAFLDGLAHYRRDLGLPAKSINWGVLKDVGVVARNPEVEAHLSRMGIEGFTTFEALAALEAMLGLEHPQLGVAKINWQTWAGQGRGRSVAPRYERLIHIAGEEHGLGLPAAIEGLIGLDEEARMEQMTWLLVETLAKVTRMAVERIDVNSSLDHMGVDSLAAVDLASHLELTLQIEIPPVMLRQARSLNNLAERLLERLGMVYKTELEEV